MVRPSGFGSTTCYFRPFQTRFRFGSTSLTLNLATHRNSPARSTKSTRTHGYCYRRALSACKPMVSGSLSLPFRGAFHLSLTVLYSIGHQVVFSLRRWASRIPTEFLVLDGTLDTHYIKLSFDYADFTLFVGTFQCSSSTSSNTFRESEPLTYFYMRFRLLPFRSPLLR